MSLGRDFRRLWAGNAAGNLADGIAFVAIPLVATTETRSPTLIAGLSLVYSLVRLLLVVPVGVLVDRVDRRLLLWAPNLVRGAVLVALSLAYATDVGSLALLYVAFAIVGIMEIAADNAAVSVLPDLVGADDLDRANGRIAAAQLVADEFVGPPLGGLLFGVAVAAPVAATGALYAAAGLLFLALPRRRPVTPADEVAAPRPAAWRQAVEGAAWIRGHRLLGGLAITGGLASVAYMMTFSILVLFARDVLDLGATGYGAILAASSLGGLLGSAVAAPLRAALGYGVVIPGALAIGAATMTGLYFTTDAYVAAALLAAYIFHVTVWSICAVSLRQRLVPDEMRGRQNSFVKLSGLIGLVVGAAAAGPLVTATDLATPFGVAGIIFAVCVAWTAWLLHDDGRSVTLAEARADFS